MNIHSAFFNTPLTDFAFLLVPLHRQYNPDSLCARLEYKFLDCLEAYGTRKAYEKCADIVYDMHECQYHTLQKLRATEMYNERMKKYKEGKLDRPFEENPPLDSFLYML